MGTVPRGEKPEGARLTEPLTRSDRDRRQAELAETLAGFPSIGARSQVVVRYGGLGLILCALGRHDLVSATASRDDDSGNRWEYHCLRCGRLVAMLCTEYDPGEDDGESEPDDPDPVDGTECPEERLA